MKIADLYEGLSIDDYSRFMEQWGEEISRSLVGMRYPDGFMPEHFQAMIDEIAASDEWNSIYRGITVPRAFLNEMEPTNTRLGVFWSADIEEAKHFATGQSYEDPRFDDPMEMSHEDEVLVIFHGSTKYTELNVFKMIGARLLWPHEKEVRIRRNGKVTIDQVLISPPVDGTWTGSNPWFDVSNRVKLGTYMA